MSGKKREPFKPVYVTEPHPEQMPGWHGEDNQVIVDSQSPGDPPHTRFVRLVERLAHPATALGRVVLDACKEVWTRVRPGGEYVLAPREEVPQALAEGIVRGAIPRPFSGRVIIASRRELVPRPEWMAEAHWRAAVGRHLETLEGGYQGEHITVRHKDMVRNGVVSLMIDGVFPKDSEQFDGLARQTIKWDGLPPDLHGPCKNLYKLMALCAGWSVLGVPDACHRVASFLVLAAKMPPIVINGPDGPHLLLLCADKPLS